MKQFIISVCILCCSAVLCTPYASSAPLSTAQLREAISAHPEILLDVLRNHSEALLDIVQEGAILRRNKATVTAWKHDLTVPKKLDTEGRLFRGSAKAPVTIVAFSDFTCPYCQKGAESLKKLMEANPGKIRYIFKSYPMDNTGLAKMTSEYFTAASLQGAGKAWALYDLLVAERTRILKDGETAVKELVAMAGLDQTRLEKDIRSTRVKSLLERDMQEGASLEIEGTPTFFINNIVVRGAVSQELFSTALNMALNAAGDR